MCTQEEFKNLVEETLLTEGKAKLGCWSLQTNGDNAMIMVELVFRFDEVAIKATFQCDTEKRKENIQTAIIKMAEFIDSKTDEKLFETYGN